MTINGVQGGGGGGGIWNMSRGVAIRMPVPGGDHLNACPGGLEDIIEACPGGICMSVPGRWRYNISLSMGAFIYCPGGGGGGYVCNYCHVICRGVRLNNGIHVAQ